MDSEEQWSDCTFCAIWSWAKLSTKVSQLVNSKECINACFKVRNESLADSFNPWFATLKLDEITLNFNGKIHMIDVLCGYFKCTAWPSFLATDSFLSHQSLFWQWLCRNAASGFWYKFNKIENEVKYYKNKQLNTLHLVSYRLEWNTATGHKSLIIQRQYWKSGIKPFCPNSIT